MIEAGRRVSMLVGAFVAVVGATVAAVLIFLGSATQLFSSSVPLSACFADVTGLRSGARVVQSGVAIGAVGKIALDPACGAGASVELLLDHDAAARLAADSRARLVTMGLLGDRLVMLIPGHSSERLSPGHVIAGEVPPDATVVIAQASDAFEVLTRIARRIDATLAEADLRVALADVGAAARALRRVLDRAERGPGLMHLLVYDRAFAAEVRRAGPLVTHAAAAAAGAEHAVSELDRALTDVRQIVGYVRSGQGTLGGVIYDPAIYEDLRTIVGKVSRSVVLRTLGRFVLKHQ